MREWSLEITGRREPSEPMFLAIARSISQDIRSGRLRPNDALPGSRTLATTLGVHRNTVLAALTELENEGWIETSPARGTFVRGTLPDPSPRALRGTKQAVRVPQRLAFDLRGPSPSAEALRVHGMPVVLGKGIYPLLGGLPDLRLAPLAAIARAYRRAILARGASPLGYGDPRGDAKLREALGSMLRQVRGIAKAEEGLVATRGSQMALYLAARAILAPGDLVVVESMGYRPAWEALRLAGARLISLPVDAEGLRVDALERLCASGERVRAVYTTPHHQYPTTALLSSGRRITLLDLARRHSFAILEDDYDHEFHYDGRPALPLASTDDAGSVVYIGTLSKVLAPGLRLGFAVAPQPVADRMSALRTFIDRQGDLVMERAIAELLEDGEIQRHIRKMRRIYHGRRDALVASVRRHLDGELSFHVPQGGLAIWARVERSLDVDAWAERAREQGVLFQTGRRFSFESRVYPGLRLGFAPLDEREIETAVKKLASVRPSAAPSSAARRRSA